MMKAIKKIAGSIVPNNSIEPKMSETTGNELWEELSEDPFQEEKDYENKLEGVKAEAKQNLDWLVWEHMSSGHVPEETTQVDWNINYLGSGQFRTVYRIGKDTPLNLENPENLVLKVTSEDETWTNKEEVDLWCNFKDEPEVVKHLAPIVDHAEDFRWVLQKKVDCDSDIDRKVVNEVQHHVRDHGLNYHDFKPSNMGFDESNQPVLVDFGYHYSDER